MNLIYEPDDPGPQDIDLQGFQKFLDCFLEVSAGSAGSAGSGTTTGSARQGWGNKCSLVTFCSIRKMLNKNYAGLSHFVF